MSSALRWFLLMTVIIAAFFWKILFTTQFSMILSWEGTNQAWSWYNFSARTIQQGILPIWDPFTESGRNFLGETQTGVFYPIKLLLYLAPLDPDGFLSERAFHQMYVLAHLLAAFFMFACAMELGIRNYFAAFVAALCFALGGFVGKVPWVHLMDSAIWLPMVFYFLLRALRSAELVRRMLFSSCAGVCLGMSILAGSIHIPLMDVFVVVSTAGLLAWRPEEQAASAATLPATSRSRIFACVLVVFVIGVVSFAAAAVQLLPSMEFSSLARRWVSEWSGPFHERIPYLVTGTQARLSPRAIFAFLFGHATTGGSEFSPYFGVMPLLLTVIGIALNWSNRWVKYLAAMGVLAFIYGMGEYSLFHGVSYLLVPFIDKSWEGGRFLYLTHFAMALLAGFGVQSLFTNASDSTPFYARLSRVLGYLVLVVALAVGIPALIEKPEINDWPYVSLFFLLATWAVFLHIRREHHQWRGLGRAMLVAVIVCDLYAFNWTFANRLHEQRAKADNLEVMKSLQPVSDFLKKQPGLFRTHFVGDFSPASMGEVFGVQTTLGYGATMIDHYISALWSPNGMCLFNVRYYLGTGEARPEAPIFTSGEWKVWRNPTACPRAWIPSRVVVEAPEAVKQRIEHESLDLLNVAYLNEQPAITLSERQPLPTAIMYGSYQPDRFELDAEVSAAGLLVMSEVYHPGWNATINGQPAHVYKVNNVLRGLIVTPGRNQIVMQYRPASFRVGGIVSLLAFFGTAIFAVVVSFKRSLKSSQTLSHGASNLDKQD